MRQISVSEDFGSGFVTVSAGGESLRLTTAEAHCLLRKLGFHFNVTVGATLSEISQTVNIADIEEWRSERKSKLINEAHKAVTATERNQVLRDAEKLGATVDFEQDGDERITFRQGLQK